MSWTIYVYIFIPVIFSTFHIPEICQIDAQNVHIAAIYVIMAVVFMQFVVIYIYMICCHMELLLPVSCGLLEVAIILYTCTLIFDKHYINEVLYLLEIC